MYKLLDNVNFYSAEEVEERFSNESAVAEKERALAAEKVLQENIDKEAQEREAADTALSDEIALEPPLREAADEKLQENIDKEQARAEEAENSLSGRLDSYSTAVTDEQKRAEDAEAKLKEEIDNEKQEREAGDTALQNNIDGEEARAAAAEEKLTADLAAEVARATDAEQLIQANLDKEVLRAQGTEHDISNAVLSESERAEKKENEINAALTEESTRAKDAEQVLQQNIDKEAQAREEADTAEKDRATAAEDKLTADLEAEVTRATGAEDTEKARAEAAEAQLEELLGKETTRAGDAEKLLQDNIDKEQARATAEEDDIKAALSTETERASAAEEANADAIKEETTRASQEEGKISNAIIKETARATKAESNITRHVMLVYQEVADMPSAQKDPNTSVTIYGGQLAYVVKPKEYYTAKVADGTVTWELYQAGGGQSTGSIPIGTVVAFAGHITQVPEAYLLCDGREVLKNDYPALAVKISERFDVYNPPSDDNHFRLPDLRKKFIEGSQENDGDLLTGEELEPGLPELSGEVGFFGSDNFNTYYEGINYKTGVFKNSREKETITPQKGVRQTTAEALHTEAATIVYKASDSNSIYGASDTVQPAAVTMCYIIKALPFDETSAESPKINDAAVSADSVWSSQKTSAEISKDKVYSTEETDTGKTWIDGKKIYRKVLEVTNEIDYSSSIEISLDIDIDTLICLNGTKTFIVKNDNDKIRVAEINGTDQNEVAIQTCLVYIVEQNLLTLSCGSMVKIKKAYIIMEYTKK